jgi:aspartyl protease family protein
MDAVFYLVVLILPLSALVARRLPLSTTLKMVAGWIAIFAVLAILVGQRERFRPLWDGAVGAVSGNEQIVTGGTVRIPMADDGHFWATVAVNGVTTRMLIDSGASITALTSATARQAGVVADAGEGVGLNTANGPIVAARGTVKALKLGAIEAHDLPVVVADAFGETDVIGMNFLSRLAGWRVEGRTLVLEPKRQ